MGRGGQESEKKFDPTLGFRIALHVDTENPARSVLEDYWVSSDSEEAYGDNNDDQSTTSSSHDDSIAGEALFEQIESSINNVQENKEAHVGVKQEGYKYNVFEQYEHDNYTIGHSQYWPDANRRVATKKQSYQ